MVKLSPSIMCADLLNLERDVRTLERGGVDFLHVDLMDGHFVLNLGLPYDLVRAVRGITHLPLDLHLAVDNPELHVELAAAAGANIITVHPQTCSGGELIDLLGKIRALRMLSCIAVSPDLPLEAVEGVLDRVNYVNLLTVNPGFAGQMPAPGAKEKLRRLRDMLSKRRSGAPIMVDGNVSYENIPWMIERGADILILGTSSLFMKNVPLGESLASVKAHISATLDDLGR